MDNTERRKQLGKAISEARLAADLSQRDLAMMTGTNQSDLWETESGRTSVGFGRLCGIVDALGSPVRDLIEF